MSVELTIQEGRWSPSRLRGFLEGWLPHAPVRVLGGMPWQSSRVGTWTWLFGEGSVRGCSLRLKTSLMKAGTLHIRLNMMASRSDWSLAHGLARGLLKAGGGRALSPDGRVLRAEDLSDSAVATEALVKMREDVMALQSKLAGGAPYAALPTPAFSLIVTPRMLPAENDAARAAIALEEHLREMAARYQAAEPVTAMLLPDRSTLSVWERDEALMYFRDHVGVQRGSDADEGVVVPAAKAVSIFGSRLEMVSEERDRYYVPALVPGTAADEKLLADLAAAGEPLPQFMARFQEQQANIFGS